VVDNELLIPDWCPEHVAGKARELHRRHSKSPLASAVIERLTNDPRMERVWRELAKRSRKEHQPTEEPIHKVTEKFAPVDQKAAVAGFFEQAANLGWLTLSLPQADKPDRPFEDRAKELRDDAEQLMRDVRPPEIGQKPAEHLLRAAEDLENVTVAVRDPAKAIGSQIALWVKQVFGNPLLKTTATVTIVITGREVTPWMVRNWVRHLESGEA
jgi:hypothetical protein